MHDGSVLRPEREAFAHRVCSYNGVCTRLARRPARPHTAGMGNVNDLLVLLALVAVIGLWLKLSAARERAATEARQQCERYGLQLLDETVGLRALRLRRVDGGRRLERCYGFEVSIDGADREPGSLWMLGNTLSELRLPTVVLTPPEAAATAEMPAIGTTSRHPTATPVEPTADHSDKPEPGSNVVPLRPRRRSGGGDMLH